MGDNSMPNPLSANVVRAGDLFDRTVVFRSDLVQSVHGFPWKKNGVHYFMRRPSTEPNYGPLSVLARDLVVKFFQTGQIIDPDGDLPVFEYPIQGGTFERMQKGLNLE